MAKTILTINLKHGYFIQIEKLNYTLMRTREIEKDGVKKEVTSTVGYYGQMEKALKTYMELATNELCAANNMELQVYIEQMKIISNEYMAQIKEELAKFPAHAEGLA